MHIHQDRIRARSRSHGIAFAFHVTNCPSRTSQATVSKSTNYFRPTTLLTTPACYIWQSSNCDSIQLQIIRYHRNAVTTASPLQWCTPRCRYHSHSQSFFSPCPSPRLVMSSALSFYLLPHYPCYTASSSHNPSSRKMALVLPLLHALQ